MWQSDQDPWQEILPLCFDSSLCFVTIWAKPPLLLHYLIPYAGCQNFIIQKHPNLLPSNLVLSVIRLLISLIKAMSIEDIVFIRDKLFLTGAVSTKDLTAFLKVVNHNLRMIHNRRKCIPDIKQQYYENSIKEIAKTEMTNLLSRTND